MSASGRWFTWQRRQESSKPPSWKSADAAVAVKTVIIIAVRTSKFFIYDKIRISCPVISA